MMNNATNNPNGGRRTYRFQGVLDEFLPGFSFEALASKIASRSAWVLEDESLILEALCRMTPAAFIRLEEACAMGAEFWTLADRTRVARPRPRKLMFPNDHNRIVAIWLCRSHCIEIGYEREYAARPVAPLSSLLAGRLTGPQL